MSFGDVFFLAKIHLKIGGFGSAALAYFGKMKDFLQQREERVERLAAKLHEALIAPDEGLYLAKTGSLLRAENLRTKSTRKAFAVILGAAPPKPYNDVGPSRDRFWTQRVVFNALKRMIKDNNVEIPQLPGFVMQTWFKEQAKVIHSLAQKANRNAKTAMGDADPTLPYNPEDRPVCGWEKSLIDLAKNKCTFQLSFPLSLEDSFPYMERSCHETFLRVSILKIYMLNTNPSTGRHAHGRHRDDWQ